MRGVPSSAFIMLLKNTHAIVSATIEAMGTNQKRG